MSETETATEPETTKRAKAKAPTEPEIVVAQRDIDDDLYGDDADANRPSCVVTSVAGKDRTIRQGDRVQATDVLPTNWRSVIHDDGSYTAWQRGNPYHDPEAMGRTLRSLDLAVSQNWPTAANPTRPTPVRLEINEAFRKLFQNVMMWGKNPAVVIGESERLNQTGWPAFEIIVQRKVERRNVGDAFGLGVIRIHKRHGAQPWEPKG